MTTRDSGAADRQSVLDHFERYLGESAGGWSQDAAGVRLPFDVLSFTDAPHAGATSYATAGLSASALRSPKKTVRMELILAMPAGQAFADAVRVLVRVGEEVLARKQALLRGDVVKLGEVFSGSQVNSVYAAVPVYYPDGMSQFDGIAVGWLIPVFDSEAKYVKRHGWQAFEDRFVAADPDLVDLRRSPMV